MHESSNGIEIPPNDAWNQELVDQVHPGDWQNPEADNPYHLVVIGAGTAGLVTAVGAAGLGARVALVEKYLMGGDCLNYGCVPSKALIRCATAYADVRDAGAYGVHVEGETRVAFGEIMERMRKLRAQISHHDSAQRFSDLGVDVFLGSGTFTSDRTIEVAGTELRFNKAAICTGARAAAPPIPGLDQIEYLNNENLFNLTELPKRLAVVGGGPIGCEMAQTFARFGSEVHLIDIAEHVLIREDADAAKIVQEAMVRDGVQLHLQAQDLAFAPGIQVSIHENGAPRQFEVDQVLIAVGRKPNVENLGLEKAGVQADPRKGIEVSDTFQTSNKRIYAAGDCCSRYQFTHAADFMARAVIGNSLFMGRNKASSLVIPWATYTDPQIAHVGLSEHAAKEQGVAIDTYTRNLAEVDRAILDGDREGFVKIHTAQGSDRILGATIVARHAGDMIGEITMAISQKIGLGKVASVIHPYPTQAEAIRQAGDLYNRTRLTPTVKTWMGRWLSWTRGK